MKLISGQDMLRGYADVPGSVLTDDSTKEKLRTNSTDFSVHKSLFSGISG